MPQVFVFFDDDIKAATDALRKEAAFIHPTRARRIAKAVLQAVRDKRDHEIHMNNAREIARDYQQ